VCHEAIAPSTFTFSVASSLLSGLHAESHGALSFEDRLPDRVRSLPEMVQDAGGETGVFAGMDYFSDEWGLARGFDRNHQPDSQDETATAERLVSEFFDWFDATSTNTDRFAVIWSFDAHLPYVKTANTFEGDSNPAIDPYDNAIRYVDGQLDRLLSGLRDRDEYDDTLFIFLADHGEVFDEHHWMESSRLARALYDWNVPVARDLLHENQLGHVAIPPYEAVIDVPMLVNFPGQRERIDADAMVQTLDLTATVGGALDLPTPTITSEEPEESFDQWQGTDLARLQEHPDEEFRDHAFVTTAQTPGGTAYRAARTRDRKAVTLTNPSWTKDTVKFYLGRRFFSKKRQAFALGDDHGAEHRVRSNVSFDQLFDVLDDHVAESQRLCDRLGQDDDSLSSAKREQLERMGYL
jgi:arylsulfatase A-like enzyme